MEMRFLGRSGLSVSTISFGAMGFGGEGFFAGVGKTQVAEARELIGLCMDAGINLFDTADVYSAGRSEEILGEALGTNRKEVLIATKAFAPMGTGPNDIGLSRKHLIEACEASLKRLNTDYIDLYQVHNFDALTPLEETLRALDDLVTSGKVRYVGCSNYAGWQLMKALAVSDRAGYARYISQQIQYSLIVRDAEYELLPAGVDQGVGALIWGPLASGYLSGKFRQATTGETRLNASGQLSSLDDERGRRVLDALTDVASGYPGATLSQAALNYLRRKAGVTSLIIGARNETQLKDNLASADWSMSDEDVERLDEASKTPVPYPISHHRRFARGRNPVPPLQPTVKD